MRYGYSNHPPVTCHESGPTQSGDSSVRGNCLPARVLSTFLVDLMEQTLQKAHAGIHNDKGPHPQTGYRIRLSRGGGSSGG